LSKQTRNAYMQFRNLVPKFEEDTVKYGEIKKINDYLCTHFIHKVND